MDFAKNSMTEPKVDILVGMQYGSESKGLIAHMLADRYGLAVRIGGPNAGHTVRTYGDVFKLRHIPATFTNKGCMLALAAGALVHPDVLEEELMQIRLHDPDIDNRLIIDPQATVIQERHVKEEHDKDGGKDMFDRIGSTREGVGAALAERILRKGGVTLAKDEPRLKRYVKSRVAEVVADTKGDVLLEGAQGAWLSNLHGVYPYCTSRETNASGIAAESGVAPGAIRNVIGVVRTYPIRVAGNSGPTGGEEIGWDVIASRVNKPVEQITERTTVTKRVRRVFEFSWGDFRYACVLNKPTFLACTFINYINKDDEGKTDFDSLSVKSREFINKMEEEAHAPVLIMSTSPDHVVIRKSILEAQY